MTVFIGVDLGQASDYTAIAGLETVSTDVGHIRHLERLPLGMPYPAQVQHIKDLSHMVPNALLIVDYTGVGRAVVDLMKQEKLSPIALTITGGTEATKEGMNWHVPKRDLIFALIVAFQKKMIKIAKSLKDADTLEKELVNFKMKVNIKTGHDSYEAWRDGVHDDLVLAVAMAVYASHLGSRSVQGSFVKKPTLANGVTT